MDVLSDILHTFRLRSSVFAMTELAAPWGMSTQGREESVFHVIVRGTAWLDADGHPPTQVCAGDVVLVSPRRRHALRDSTKTRARPIEQLLAEGVFAPGRKPPPPGAASTTVMCGVFHLDDVGAEMLFAALPKVVHVREVAEAHPWLDHTMKLIGYECASPRPGGTTVVNRLCDSLFVYIMRGIIESAAATNASWLRGLADPHVSAALRLIHDQPGKDWTVAMLASAAGLSRSGFALRFGELVGEPPMRYLTRWRFHKAAEQLARADASIAEIAARFGYETEASFSKAFKRTLGVAPGAHRRRAREASPSIPSM